MDITHDIPPTQSIPLINYANNNKLPLIIGSDTNAQHTLWGNRECNKRGEDLIDLFNSLGLSWANKGSTPTFINSRGHESIIDLTRGGGGQPHFTSFYLIPILLFLAARMR